MPINDTTIVSVINFAYGQKVLSFFHVTIDDGECQNTVLFCFELPNAVLVERSIDHDLVVNKNVSPTAGGKLIIYSHHQKHFCNSSLSKLV